MESNFVAMNETYKRKHFPDELVFAAIQKKSKKMGIGIYFFFVPFMIISIVGAIYSTKLLIETVSAGDEEMISVGIFSVCACLVFFLITLLPVIMTKKRNSMSTEAFIRSVAKNSACNEREILKFERQAMSFDSYILSLTEKYKAVLNGQRDGILTKDYIYLADNNSIVLKFSDIVGAFLVERITTVMANNKSKRIHSLTISLVSNKNVQTYVDTSIEAGTELLAILLEKNPQIETRGGSVIQEKEFDQYCKKLKNTPQ